MLGRSTVRAERQLLRAVHEATRLDVACNVENLAAAGACNSGARVAVDDMRLEEILRRERAEHAVKASKPTGGTERAKRALTNGVTCVERKLVSAPRESEGEGS